MEHAMEAVQERVIAERVEFSLQPLTIDWLTDYVCMVPKSCFIAPDPQHVDHSYNVADECEEPAPCRIEVSPWGLEEAGGPGQYPHSLRIEEFDRRFMSNAGRFSDSPENSIENSARVSMHQSGLTKNMRSTQRSSGGLFKLSPRATMTYLDGSKVREQPIASKDELKRTRRESKQMADQLSAYFKQKLEDLAVSALHGRVE